MNKATAILIADMHLRDDSPVCRTDDYWMAQVHKLGWLHKLQSEHKCPILCAGDVTHRWNCSPFLLAWAIRFLPQLTAVAGNHDLPQHNAELYEKSGLNVLAAANAVHIPQEPRTMGGEGRIFELFPFPYGEELHSAPRRRGKHPRVALCHSMTWLDTSPFPNATGAEAHALLERMRGYDLVVTGDNHQQFVVANDQGQLLINPGSLMRMTADQVDHTPGVFLWFAETNTYRFMAIPCEPNVVSREHIERVQAREDRLEAFVERLKGTDFDGELNFRENMEQHLDENQVNKAVRECVWEAMEAE